MTLRQKALISISVTTVVILGVVFVYWRSVSNFLLKSQSIADSRVLIDTEAKRARDVSLLKQQVVVARSQQEKVSQFFLQKDQIAPFLGYIESIGNSNKSLVTIGSVEIEKGTKSNSLVVTFKISGTYQQVMSTLEYIEKIPYYSRVQKVILNVAPGSGGGDITNIVGVDGKSRQIKTPVTEPLWSADVTLVVFSFIDSTSATQSNTSVLVPVTTQGSSLDVTNTTTVPKSIN